MKEEDLDHDVPHPSPKSGERVGRPAMIKMMAATVCASFVLSGYFAIASDKGSTKDPCGTKDYSNVELRHCYAKEQSRVNTEVDELAKGMAADFRRDAKEEISGNGISEALRKAAVELLQSQNAWKASRDHLCNAVAYSYTTGSGAGTAYQKCMYELGRSRQRELEAAFK
ncbi:MAG TPA: lysozyme inhibitor LprI family protein [Candidatus Angelobacter sp.]|nr:lysozyme inhibitor LprI family protein [Candidatus Angelobacter sp.]